MKLTQNFRI